MIKKILQSIEKQKISIGEWLTAFAGIVFIRFILEIISSPTSSGVMQIDPQTLVHYGLSFLAIALGLICLSIYLNNGNLNLLKIILFGMPLIWIGPILDIITSFGDGRSISYIFEGGRQLFYSFLTFFGSDVTFGLRIEMLIILCVIGFYIWYIKKDKKKTIITIISSYIFLFFIFSIPSLIFIVSNKPNTIDQTNTYNVLNFLDKEISKSNISHNTLNPTLAYNSALRSFELIFDKFLSQISFLLAFIFLALIFYKTKKEKFFAVIKNSRPERVIMYITLICVGIGYSFILNLSRISNWIDIMSVIILFISWYGAWMFAVHTNDIEDELIDLTSNSDRPIATKKLSVKEMREVSLIWLMISLFGSYTVGYYPFFMNLLFTASYYIYSIPPLRLKRIPILSSFLISIACLSSVLTGFFFFSIKKELYNFPSLLAIGILVMFTLSTNIRDLKDIDGDKKEGIMTLPVIFGTKGRKIVAIMFALSFFLSPIFFSSFTLYVLALPTGVLGYKFVMKNPYRERNLFYLFFSFIISCVFLIWFIFWLAGIMHISA